MLHEGRRPTAVDWPKFPYLFHREHTMVVSGLGSRFALQLPERHPNLSPLPLAAFASLFAWQRLRIAHDHWLRQPHRMTCP